MANTLVYGCSFISYIIKNRSLVIKYALLVLDNLALNVFKLTMPCIHSSTKKLVVEYYQFLSANIAYTT